jgi:ABC-2 type transport system ATP-binding protein
VTPAVEVNELVVRYGDKTAVDGVSFDVRPGEVLALLGHNGAGKTSTVEVCEGYKPATAGHVQILGKDPWHDHDEVMPYVGVMLQNGGVHPSVRAGEALRLIASFAAAPLDVDTLAERLGLTQVLRTGYRRLSGGERQRLHFAMAIVSRPAVVFLDEPTAGMDVAARHTTWDLVAQLRSSGVAVLLTTHFLDEAERLADRVVVMRDGQVAVTGTPAELTTAAGTGRIVLHSVPGLPVEPLADGARTVESAPGEYEISGFDQLGLVIGAAVTWCARHNAPITDIRTVRPSLEDIFLAAVTRKDG